MRPYFARHEALRLLPIVISLQACTLDFDQFAQPLDDPDFINLDEQRPEVGPADLVVFPDYRLGADGDMGGGLDTDSDGVLDGTDNCPTVANPDQADLDVDAQGDLCDDDADGDTVPDVQDNCAGVNNENQNDFDRDGQGDACDQDPDGDGLSEADEQRLGTDPRARDTDGDGSADGMDLCPRVADRQGLDKDGDMAGDACDLDDDNDQVPDWRDNCAFTTNAGQEDADGTGPGDACATDADGDGVMDGVDNCPVVPNADQAQLPCLSRFKALTFTRDVRAIVRSAAGVEAATAGGLVSVDAENVRVFTRADGLSASRFTSLFVDAANRRFMVSEDQISILRPDGFTMSVGRYDAGGGPLGQLRGVVVDATNDLWVASDAGLHRLTGTTWTTLSPPQIPSLDVRSLSLDPQGRLWVATAAGAVRMTAGVVDRTISGLPDGDAMVRVAFDADGSFWFLTEGGVSRLATDDVPAPTHSFPGLIATDFTLGPQGSRHLATSDGIVRIDADFRVYPSGALVLPSSDVRAVVHAGDGPRWVGTSDGMVKVEGVFSTFLPEPTALSRPCAVSTKRIGSNLWVGTDLGLYLQRPDGSAQRIDSPGGYPGETVRVIRVVNSEVFVGTDLGIGVYDLEGTPIRTLTAMADQLPAAPISDIAVGLNGDVWIASEGNGLVRRDAAGMTTAFTVQNQNPANFLSNQIKALAHDGTDLWIGTDAGVARWEEAGQRFVFPVTLMGGQLPDLQIQGIAVGGGHVFVATRQGLAVKRPNVNNWTTLRRSSGGWSALTGKAGAATDYVRAVAYDGTYLWLHLAESQMTHPNGLLVRRRGLDPLPEGSNGVGIADQFTPENAGTVPAIGSSVTLEIQGGELFSSVCGTDLAPGGFSVLDGQGVIVRDLAPSLGLAGDGVVAALTTGPEGQALFATVVDGATTLATLADAPTGPTLAPFTLPPSVLGMPVKCGLPPGGGELWCALAGVGIGRRLNAQNWIVLGEPIPALTDTEVRDIAVESGLAVAVATTKGVVRINQGNPRLFNEAGTGGGLPSNDVRAVSWIGGKLYAATSKGIGIFDPVPSTWTSIRRAVGQLGNEDVRCLASGVDGAIYFGTGDGVYRMAPDGTFADFHAGLGLPSNDVRSLAVHTDGRLFVGTSSGVAIGTPGAPGQFNFSAAGAADGLVGRAVHDLFIDVAGVVWLRSDDGVAVLSR